MNDSLLRRVLATAAIAAATTVVMSGAQAGVPAADRVYPRNLPTHAQAARIYDGLDGGYRDVHRNRYLQIRAADCVSWGQGPKARSGRWAAYYGKGGKNPYFKGLPNPSPFVYKFHTGDQTRKAFRTAYRAATDCLGMHTDGDLTIRSRAVDVPALGGRAFAVREHESENTREDYFLYVWVHEGRYVTTTMVQRRDAAPSKKQAIRLTRVTLDRIP